MFTNVAKYVYIACRDEHEGTVVRWGERLGMEAPRSRAMPQTSKDVTS